VSQDNKAVSIEIKEGKLLISVDSNKDGQALAVLSVDLLEVPDEVVNLFKKKDEIK